MEEQLNFNFDIKRYCSPWGKTIPDNWTLKCSNLPWSSQAIAQITKRHHLNPAFNWCCWIEITHLPNMGGVEQRHILVGYRFDNIKFYYIYLSGYADSIEEAKEIVNNKLFKYAYIIEGKAKER
jgi:hypothetical protein